MVLARESWVGKRWTDLQNVIASYGTCWKAEEDNLPVSEVKYIISMDACGNLFKHYFSFLYHLLKTQGIFNICIYDQNELCYLKIK